MSGEGGDAPAPMPATIDNFDAAMANVNMDADTGAGPDASDGDAPQQALGSMFEAFADPVAGADGREVDAPPGIPTGDEDDAAPDDVEAAPDDVDASDDDIDAEEAANPEQELLGSLELDGLVPDELMERLKMVQTINGEKHEVTLKEAAENGMRLVDYSRSKRELAGAKQEHQQAVDSFVELTERWKSEAADGRQATRRDLERLGIPLQAIAQDIAEEFVALQNMSETERASYERARKLEREAWEAKEKLRQMEAKAQASERSGKTSDIRQKVEGWRDRAMKGAGLHDSPTTRKLFADHLGALWDRSEPISEDVVKTAVQAARQEWAEIVDRHQASQQTTQRAKKKPLSPKPAPRGAGKGAPRKQMKATLDNFDDFVAGR